MAFSMVWFGDFFGFNAPYSMGKTVSCRFSLKSIDGSWPRGHHVDVPDLRASGTEKAHIAIPMAESEKNPKKVQGYKLYVYMYIYIYIYI